VKFSAKNIRLSDSIENRELERFKSYLSNGEHFTRVSGVDSKIREIEIGVP